MKTFKTTVALFSFAICLTIGSVSSYATEEIQLTPAQQKEVELAKKRTIQEREHPSKKFDPKVVQMESKQRGVSYDTILKQQEIGATSVGTKGDILVTLSGVSSGSSAWAGGHAGIVSEVAGFVVESYGNKKESENGVQHWRNNWDDRYKHVRGLWVKQADGDDYNYAASHARAKIGLPYNFNFFNTSTTSRFYCSQLVWRAWYNKGFDLNDGGAVWPVDLIESPKTTIFYSKG
ncbi:YiiX/YebB-like N1pC/P60 family cysteine hydrolase [Thermoactinomyces sp. DSM 45892]|uniref:YiiX/YebB-like N1pC/P60 family cysteine hydrolase n=1 Tax=Thermoactinomyces sp. DSM 45892 TaxID=1882753 RepID=UPI00089A2DA1|nr:YiiX/YebB-like N1pC/P60 family cysteine hydrolase [Thermoactinomyces sp. DSM 45892]SDY86702.1 Uncharacterized protein YycO [Thermoactinomyces sp. DSM 45892]